MRRILCTSLFFLLTASSLRAQFGSPDLAPENVIRVKGEGQVQVSPDRFVAGLGVIAEGPTMAAAIAANDAHAKNLLAWFTEAGLTAAEIQTVDFSLRPTYAHKDAEEKEKPTGYRAAKTFAVSLADLARLENVLHKSYDRGANRIYSIHFHTTHLKEHRDRARELAIELAREKATKLAAAAGRTLGPVLSITETGGSVYEPGEQTPERQMSEYEPSLVRLAEGSTLSPGTLSITAELVVDFALK
jgi:uncharacterized protein YggE